MLQGYALPGDLGRLPVMNIRSYFAISGGISEQDATVRIGGGMRGCEIERPGRQRVPDLDTFNLRSIRLVRWRSPHTIFYPDVGTNDILARFSPVWRQTIQPGIRPYARKCGVNLLDLRADFPYFARSL